MLESHLNVALYDHPGNMFLRKLKKEANKQTDSRGTHTEKDTNRRAGRQADRQTETNITQDLLR